MSYHSAYNSDIDDLSTTPSMTTSTNMFYFGQVSYYQLHNNQYLLN